MATHPPDTAPSLLFVALDTSAFPTLPRPVVTGSTGIPVLLFPDKSGGEVESGRRIPHGVGAGKRASEMIVNCNFAAPPLAAPPSIPPVSLDVHVCR
jgi:hypothetical protein